MFKVVDLFAGPGGLAEGFSAVPGADGEPAFDIALSVEKENSAFRTLRLRSFVRKFGRRIPENYARYVQDEITLDALIATSAEHQANWDAAVEETEQLTLGTEQASARVDQRIREIKAEWGANKTILIGGPPCQAYSLVGRARNRGIAGYDPGGDHRHFLYEEYIRILKDLRPAAFVMENVKGLLSSRVNEQNIFELIVDDLASAGYRLLPLAGPGKGPQRFVVRAEDFGVPQARHRVILLGLKEDLAKRLPEEMLRSMKLNPEEQAPTVATVLRNMPNLRSGLSKSADGHVSWRSAAARACRTAAGASASAGMKGEIAQALRTLAAEIETRAEILPRQSVALPSAGNDDLSAWLRGRGLQALPNHETRGHMEEDLARYAFAAVFADLEKSSPKAGDFPPALAPEHANWETGKFADRFRVQLWDQPSSTITSHISKDGHYFIHPDPAQCRSLTVREAARLQTFPDDYFFEGNRTQQFVQVGNAVPPLLAFRIARLVAEILEAISARSDAMAGGNVDPAEPVVLEASPPLM